MSEENLFDELLGDEGNEEEEIGEREKHKMPLGGIPESRKKGENYRALEKVGKFRFQDYSYDLGTMSLRPRRLDLTSMELTDVNGIQKFNHICYVDLSCNRLNLAGLTKLSQMQNLVTLILDHNRLVKTTLPQMAQLMYLSIGNNFIEEMTPFIQPKLEFVHLNYNKIKFIDHVSSRSLPVLHTLSVSHCQVRSMNTIYSMTLTRLYLTYNKLTRIEGLSGLFNLAKLNLRGNGITQLTGFNKSLAKLFYVNVRENKITDGKEFDRLKVLPMLRVVVFLGNPVDKALKNQARILMLKAIPEMRRINKFFVEDEEREAAKLLRGSDSLEDVAQLAENEGMAPEDVDEGYPEEEEESEDS